MSRMEPLLERDKDVALVRCESYERGVVEERVARAFDLVGGPAAVVKPGESVFLKVNALLAYEPDRAVTTHPEVVRAVALQLQNVTDRITIGDNPGGPFNVERVYEKTGFAKVAEETGCSLCLDSSARQVVLHEGRCMKSFTISEAMASADRLVSVSKFKTHMSMNVTCAVKNMFGAVPGMNKFTYHGRFSREEDFANLIVDVALASDPDFHVVDAVIGMDGNGPRQGRARPLGVIAAGRDAFAVDLAMMGVIAHEPRVNKPLAAAIDRGLCPPITSDLNLVGDDLRELAVADFVMPARKDIGSRVPGFVMDKIGGMVSLRPVPSARRCTGCMMCAKVCPENAVMMVDSVARIDTRKCIKCYCCHELCEADAIDLEKPWLMRLARIKTD